MNSIWDASFIVVDVETTGSNAEKNRVFDIACIRVENGEIVSEYSSLINPHQFIPPFIANMTGVSNEKVYSAPESSVVFKEVYKFLFDKPAIFVAHNAQFDLAFVRETFKRMGINMEIPVLCTLKLAKRLMPKALKKNVGSLADYFGHNIRKRHRAYDDTLATVVILNEFLEIAEEEYNVSTIEELLAFQNKPIKHLKATPPEIRRVQDILSTLPDSPGVYYFYGKDNKILYIGKSKSLKSRVSSYFTFGEHSSKKIADLVKKVYDIKWTTVPTELEALLLESSEIKKHKPFFNSVQKKYRRYPFIKICDDEFPYPVLSRGKEDDGGILFGPFRSASFVNEILLDIEKRFKLRNCRKKLNPNEDNKPCFYYHLEKCLAPCANHSSKEEYLAEVEKVKYYLSGYSDGIIKQLQLKMEEHSENLEFEKANILKSQIFELKKTFMANHTVGSSLTENDMIMILPEYSESNTADLYFIRAGKFELSKTVGYKQNLGELQSNIHSVYFNGLSKSSKLELEEIDEIKIVSSWIYKNMKFAKQVYIENKSEEAIFDEIETIFKGITQKEQQGSEEIVFDDITVDFFFD